MTTKAALEQAAADACWAEEATLQRSFNKLNITAAAGNDAAAEYLVDHLSLIDGGNLEDALISLGLYSDRKMRRFMTLAVNKRISEVHFTSALATLPARRRTTFSHNSPLFSSVVARS